MEGVGVFLAVAGFLLIVVPMPYRIWAASRLLNGYSVDDYLRDPLARKLWISNFALAFSAPLGILLLGFSSRIWWVEMWTSIIAFAIAYRIVWKLWIRLSGRHREYYRRIQWSGPASTRYRS